jgi:membrane protein required for colicin V production
MNTLDIVVVVVLLLSAGFAYMRGFVRELLAIVAWLGAALITFYGYIYIVPFAEKFLPKGPIANIGAGGAVFLVALIILSIITASVARRVSQSGMSSFDRLFGLIFGLARGAVLVSLGYIALNWYLPPDKPQPEWMTQSHSRPLLQAGANMLEAFIPSKWRDQVKTTATREPAKSDNANDADAATRALAQPKPSAKPANPAPAYKPQDRADMDRLINQQQDQQQGQQQ